MINLKGIRKYKVFSHGVKTIIAQENFDRVYKGLQPSIFKVSIYSKNKSIWCPSGHWRLSGLGISIFSRMNPD